MIIRKVLFILAMIFLLNGCYVGPATYEVFKKNNNININNHITQEKYYWIKKNYNDKYYIYIPKINRVIKNCIYGYLVKKDDPKMKIVGWKILSGKEYCKERQATVLIQ